MKHSFCDASLLDVSTILGADELSFNLSAASDLYIVGYWILMMTVSLDANTNEWNDEIITEKERMGKWNMSFGMTAKCKL